MIQIKIVDVIAICDKLLPNEFTFDEKLMWCNELGAMLVREHMPTFEKQTISQNKNGTYTLPLGIHPLDVDRFISNGKVFKKKDKRHEGITYLSAQKGECGIPISFNAPQTGSVDIIYRKKYQQLAKSEIETMATINNNTIIMDDYHLKAGDTLDIINDNGFYFVTITNVTHQDDGTVVLDIVSDSDMGEQGTVLTTFCRYITDKTVIDSPFDMLYVDFINAKICFYQRDYTNYNAHMTVFNSRLEDLRKFLSKTMPSSPDTVLKNWY